MTKTKSDMDKDTVEKVKELDANIKKATNDVENLNCVPFDFGSISVGYNIIETDATLMGAVIKLIVNHKEQQIKEWQKELDEL